MLDLQPLKRAYSQTNVASIRTEVVRELVLDAIKSVSGYVRENEAEFIERIRESSVICADETAKVSRRKLAQNQKQIAELDHLFKKTYEDNANGKLSDKRVGQLSADYEREQTDLEAKNAALQVEIDTYAADSLRADRFIEIVRIHTEFEELSASCLNEFISRILVHQADKSSGERIQEVEVIFNFIGMFEPLSEPPAPPTVEELAAEEKRREKLVKQREAYRRWYAKKKAAQSAE